jgi:hypothetical protein
MNNIQSYILLDSTNPTKNIRKYFDIIIKCHKYHIDIELLLPDVIIQLLINKDIVKFTLGLNLYKNYVDNK